MRLTITDQTVTVQGKTIFSHLNFEIRGRERICVVGANGSGKTTLLRLLNGELFPDTQEQRRGNGIETDKKLTVGMLHQTIGGDLTRTVEEYLEEGLFSEVVSKEERYSRERFEYETRFHQMFTGFGFSLEEKRKPLSEFSGGEQTKISLIHLLLQKPDLLLLDEPTNHLDLKSIRWFEEYLRTYPNAVVIVSHDRYFIDEVATAVCEVKNGKITRYPGGYTAYREQKKKHLESTRKAYEKQQEELARLNALVERFKNKPRKAAFARSRKKLIERMEEMEKPEEGDEAIRIADLTPEKLGSKWTLEAKDLKIGYDHPLFCLTLRVKRGNKLGITGENGTGKTTLLKTAAGLLPKLGGELTTGNDVTIGYFDQNSAALTSTLTVAEYFLQAYPSVSQKDARSYLAAFLFPGREAQKTVSVLSGGEKARLALAMLLFERPNLLILDEPTNHMDIPAKEAIERALIAYPGTILVVSHDRYFLKQVARETLILEKGEVYYYPFDYAHYLEREKRRSDLPAAARIAAEEQALIAGLRAVPKEEYHESRLPGEDEAYIEWKLSFVEEKIEAVTGKISVLEKKMEELKLWLGELQLRQENEEEARSALERLKEEKEERESEWTMLCMEWFEIRYEE